MKPGARVKLTEQLEDLPAGSQGIVVMAKENSSKDGAMLFPYTFTGYTVDVPAVHFDGMQHAAITRRIGDKVIQVVSKCTPV